VILRSSFKAGVSNKSFFVTSSTLVATCLGIASGTSIAGLLSIASGLVDLTGTGEDTSVLLIFGSFITLIFSFSFRYISDARLNKSETLLAVTCGFISCILTTSLVYLIVGDVSSFSDSFFESTAAFTTTSLTVLDVNKLGNGMLFLRSVSQLLGSFTAMLTAVMFLPVSEHQHGSTSSELRVEEKFFQRRGTAIKNIALIYLISTVLIAALLSFGEMSIFVSLLTSISAVSTGGFTTNSDYLTDPSVQWLLSAGMLATGTSFLILWRLATGKVASVFRSTELHTYLLLIALSTLLLYFWTSTASQSSFRQSLLFTTSSISTTGFHFLPFGKWSVAVSFLLLLLIAIGPMSLSSGGGFQILRLRILFGVSIRELVRQLHPRAIVKIRVGKESIDDEKVRQVVVFQFLFLSVAFVSSVILTCLGMSVYEAFASSVNALATAGPIRAVDGSIIQSDTFSSGERLALVPAMISGRLYLLPVFVTFGYLLSESRNFLRPRRRFLRWKSSSK